MEYSELVTVIVPVYNVEKYLSRCLESIISQDYENLEIFVVNDGSTDNSGKICKEYLQKDNRIHVIDKENGGLSSARNIALDQMSGDYIFFIDSDDYIFPKTISTLVNACHIYNAEVACCGYKSGRKVYYCSESVNVLNNVEATKRMFVCQGIDSNAVCKLYKKELFENIRYPLCAYEVVPVTYRVLMKTNNVAITNHCGYYIEKRSGSITRSEFGDNNLLYVKMAKDELELIRKDFPFLEEYARTFYLEALVSMRERAEEDTSKDNIDKKIIIERWFEEEFVSILIDKHLSLRKKIIAILVKLHLYNVVRTMYTSTL